MIVEIFGTILYYRWPSDLGTIPEVKNCEVCHGEDYVSSLTGCVTTAWPSRLRVQSELLILLFNGYYWRLHTQFVWTMRVVIREVLFIRHIINRQSTTGIIVSWQVCS